MVTKTVPEERETCTMYPCLVPPLVGSTSVWLFVLLLLSLAAGLALLLQHTVHASHREMDRQQIAALQQRLAREQRLRADLLAWMRIETEQIPKVKQALEQRLRERLAQERDE
jgi:hypothetical protein